MKYLLHAVVSKVLATNFKSTFAESDATGRAFCEVLDAGAQCGFSFDDFGDIGILVRPRHCRAVRRSINQEWQAGSRVISELARKRHFHVDLVAGVKRH